MTTFWTSFFNLDILLPALPVLWRGLLHTLQLALFGIIVGALGGIALALLGTSPHRYLRVPAMLWTDLFRALPPLVLLILLYAGLPFIGLDLGAWGAVILTFFLNTGAYYGEVFRAGGSAVPGESVTAAIMIDARLQEPSVSRTADPLLADLLRRGEVAEEVLVDDDGAVLRNTGEIRVRPADGALLDAHGRVHPRRFAIGPHTNVRVAGAFTRPGTNAQSLRYNDAVARAVLLSLPGARSAAA